MEITISITPIGQSYQIGSQQLTSPNFRRQGKKSLISNQQIISATKRKMTSSGTDGGYDVYKDVNLPDISHARSTFMIKLKWSILHMLCSSVSRSAYVKNPIVVSHITLIQGWKEIELSRPMGLLIRTGLLSVMIHTHTTCTFMPLVLIIIPQWVTKTKIST